LATPWTISSSVTTRERVGRTINTNAKQALRLKELSMSASLNHGSAQIYQFPAGGRAALGGRRYGEAKSAISQNTPQVNETISSGSWYHEEAIRESTPGFKPTLDH
jgi:hypothetical protein